MPGNFDRNDINPEYPELPDLDARVRLARMVMRLFELWSLSSEDQCQLLGISAQESALLDLYRSGGPLAYNAETLRRVGHFLGIHKSLRTFYPYDRDLVYRWISHPNRHFEGRRPLDIMREGEAAILAIRNYLEFELVR